MYIYILLSSVRENIQPDSNIQMHSKLLKEIQVKTEELQKIKEENNRLKSKIAQLETNLQRKDEIIINMKIDTKEQEQRIADILSTVLLQVRLRDCYIQHILEFNGQ